MSMLPSVGWADVATKQDLAAMRHDLAALEQRMEARSAALEERMNIRFDASEARILGDVNKALREQMRTMVFALIGAVFTMTSLNLTAIALLRR